MKAVIKFIALISVLFYALCWFSTQPTKLLHNIGIALPWLSLFISIPVGFIFNIKEKDGYPTWGCVYAALTILYTIVVSMIAGSIWHQVPHLATCACFIAYFTIEQQYKQNKS